MRVNYNNPADGDSHPILITKCKVLFSFKRNPLGYAYVLLTDIELDGFNRIQPMVERSEI